MIVQKINLRYPHYVKGVWNLGAFVCALICLLIHGMIGFDSLSLLQEGTVFDSYLWNASSSETYRKRLGLYSYFCPPLECLFNIL